MGKYKRQDKSNTADQPIRSIQVSMSENSDIRKVQRQENYNKLSAIKSSRDKCFLIESQPGIGTMYDLQTIFNSINDTFFSHCPMDTLEALNDVPKETVVLDANVSVEQIKTDDIFKKLIDLGFKKIVIVVWPTANRPETEFSSIMVD